MYQLERFEEHESVKEDLQKWFDDPSAYWTDPWPSCNAISTYKDNDQFNGSFGDYLLSTSFLDLLKKAASKQLGHKVSHVDAKLELWLNVYEHNFFQEPHDHLSGDGERPPDLCFSYFFEVPDEPLFFFLKGNEQHYIKEQSGTVAFFDANQYHGVDLNPENKPRKTVSGNLWIVKNDD